MTVSARIWLFANRQTFRLPLGDCLFETLDSLLAPDHNSSPKSFKIFSLWSRHNAGVELS
jgi:hypothetical protein